MPPTCFWCGLIEAHANWCPAMPRVPKASVPELLIAFARYCRDQEVFASVYDSDDKMKELTREFLRQR